jgi:hypothetical protein
MPRFKQYEINDSVKDLDLSAISRGFYEGLEDLNIVSNEASFDAFLGQELHILWGESGGRVDSAPKYIKRTEALMRKEITEEEFTSPG